MYYKSMNKHRLYIQTSRGNYTIAAADNLEELPGKAREWLEGTSEGRSVYDDQTRALVLYKLAKGGGSYEFAQRAPVTDRTDIIEKIKQFK